MSSCATIGRDHKNVVEILFNFRNTLAREKVKVARCKQKEEQRATKNGIKQPERLSSLAGDTADIMAGIAT
jgi:hypothetical protein